MVYQEYNIQKNVFALQGNGLNNNGMVAGSSIENCVQSEVHV